MSEMMCAPGDLIKQRYRIEEPLGRGSFAQVFRAIDTVLGRPVAVKLMSPRVKHAPGTDRATKERELVTRFHNEARAAAILMDIHSVAIYDFGSRPDGVLFMVQEFVPGNNLRSLIKKQGTMDPIRVANILKGACQSLKEAHAHGLIHRDIKPENIMVFDHMGDADQVRVVDFGIAKILEQDDNLTAAGHLIGTPRYVAPERIKQLDLTPASDLYSLGCCAYFMLTAREMYEGLDTMAILRAHVAPGDETLPQDAQLPEELRQIVNRLLCKELSDRWPAAKQVIEALDDFIIAQHIINNPRFAALVSPDDPDSYAKTQAMPSVSMNLPVDPSAKTDALPAVTAPGSTTIPRMEPLRTDRPVQRTHIPNLPTIPAQEPPASPIQQIMGNPKMLGIFAVACLMLALIGIALGATIVALLGK